jgi:hypothetical protein
VFYVALLLVALALAACLYFLPLALSPTRAADPPRARPGTLVGHSDGRTAATRWLFLPGLLLPPLAIVAMLLLLALDGCAWLRAARAALRQRRRQPPAACGFDFGLGPDWTLEPSPIAPYRASAAPVLVARGSPRAAAWAIAGNMGRLLLAAIGATLWLGLWLGACVCVPVRNRPHAYRVRTALSTARSAAIIWRQDFPGRCPTIDQLKAAKVLDTGFNAKDAWGNPIELTCDSDEIRARTAGPDRRLGTEDDILVPPPEADETSPALAHRATPAYTPSNPR